MTLVPDEIFIGTELILLILFFLEGLLDNRLYLNVFSPFDLSLAFVVVDQAFVQELH